LAEVRERKAAISPPRPISLAERARLRRNKSIPDSNGDTNSNINEGRLNEEEEEKVLHLRASLMQILSMYKDEEIAPEAGPSTDASPPPLSAFPSPASGHSPDSRPKSAPIAALPSRVMAKADDGKKSRLRQKRKKEILLAHLLTADLPSLFEDDIGAKWPSKSTLTPHHSPYTPNHEASGTLSMMINIRDLPERLNLENQGAL